MSLWIRFITWIRLRNPIEAEMVNRVHIVDKVDEVNLVDYVDNVDNLDMWTCLINCQPQARLKPGFILTLK